MGCRLLKDKQGDKISLCFEASACKGYGSEGETRPISSPLTQISEFKGLRKLYYQWNGKEFGSLHVFEELENLELKVSNPITPCCSLTLPPSLRFLNLTMNGAQGNEQFQDVLSQIEGLKGLEKLTFKPDINLSSTRDLLLELSGHLPPNLREFSFEGFCYYDKVSEASIQNFNRVSSLKVINFKTVSFPQDEAMPSVRFREIEDLTIEHCSLEFQNLPLLFSEEKLKTLKIFVDKRDLTEDAFLGNLDVLRKFQRLEILVYQDCKITKLTQGGQRVVDEISETIKGIECLTSLKIATEGPDFYIPLDLEKLHLFEKVKSIERFKSCVIDIRVS